MTLSILESFTIQPGETYQADGMVMMIDTSDRSFQFLNRGTVLATGTDPQALASWISDGQTSTRGFCSRTAKVWPAASPQRNGAPTF